MNLNSHHPIEQKNEIVYNLVDKGINLSHSEFHQYNIQLIKSFFLANSYPSDFIDIHVDKRLKILMILKIFFECDI